MSLNKNEKEQIFAPSVNELKTEISNLVSLLSEDDCNEIIAMFFK